jgi:centromeric protein E
MSVSSQILDSNPGPAPTGSPPAAPPSLLRQVSHLRKRTKSVDEMSRMLDEMIQDRVESGQIIRGNRGSVRVAPERKVSSPALSPVGPPPPGPPAGPPIQLQLLSRHRASFVSDPQKPLVLEV